MYRIMKSSSAAAKSFQLVLILENGYLNLGQFGTVGEAVYQYELHNRTYSARLEFCEIVDVII